MSHDHIVKQFDTDLESIRTRVLQMGGLVERQIVKAMAGLGEGDLANIKRTIDNDHQVNRLEVELDEACTQIVARRQPTAVDLRMIMMVVKTITDLERVGDEAKKIAKMALKIHEEGVAMTPRIDLQHIADSAVAMLRMALDAYARLDLNAAAEVVRRDQAVDHEFKGIMRQLITFMMEDPRTISRAIDLLFVAKSIERIGDHAKNICEYVVYMVNGRDVRHIGLEGIEKEVAG